MKNKKGFTLIEVLGVIAIIAILTVVAVPNVLEMYRKSRRNIFLNEVRTIYSVAKETYVNDSMDYSGVNAYARSEDNIKCTKELNLDGEDVYYYIELYGEGNVIKIYAKNKSFQYKLEGSDIKKTDIVVEDVEDISDAIQTFDISCEGIGGVSGERIEYTVVYNKNDANATGETASSSHVYGERKRLTANGFSLAGKSFMGWALSENGNAVYADNAEVLNLTNENGGIINLYAIWGSESPHGSYWCRNIHEGDAPYVLTYTGDCEKNGGSNDWWFKFLTNGELTLNKPLSVDLFLVGGGGLGAAPTIRDCNAPYPLDYIVENGCSTGASGGTGGETKTISSVSLSTGTTYAITIGIGGHCTGENHSCDTVANSTSTTITNISGATANGGARGGGGAKNSKGADGKYAFNSAIYGTYAGSGGGGCSLSYNQNFTQISESFYGGRCFNESGGDADNGGDGGAGGAGHGCNNFQGHLYPNEAEYGPNVNAEDNSGSGGGGGSAWCIGHGGSGVVLMRKHE